MSAKQNLTTKITVDLELALNLLINKRHHDACMARLQRESAKVIERLDREYEQALDTYRLIIGKEPTAAYEASASATWPGTSPPFPPTGGGRSWPGGGG